MVTRNFKELLGLVLGATSEVSALRPVKDVNGRLCYASPQFNNFPYSVSTSLTLQKTYAGISVGTGDTAATENDYNLESTITSGVSLALASKTSGCDGGCPYVEFRVTVTNTGSDAVTVKEICYKQQIAAVAKLGGRSSSNTIVMLDRTVLSTPMTVAAGDAGIIVYRLKTDPMGGKTVNGVKIVDFAHGTDAEITDMIDAARLGTIDLQTDGGWRVGDQRIIHLDSWTGGDDTQFSAGDTIIVITSFEEYGSCGNLFQFDFMNCSGPCRMNANTAAGLNYGTSEMYRTTLPALVEALPSWLRTRLKTFSVPINVAGNAESVPNNKLALRSQMEVSGGNSPVGEGVQLEYYKILDSRRKTSMVSGDVSWWTRTFPTSSYSVMVATSGIPANQSPAVSIYLAPFGCV